MATRNRVIYQSEALYVGQPEATGNHITATVIGGQDDGGGGGEGCAASRGGGGGGCAARGGAHDPQCGREANV